MKAVKITPTMETVEQKVARMAPDIYAYLERKAERDCKLSCARSDARADKYASAGMKIEEVARAKANWLASTYGTKMGKRPITSLHQIATVVLCRNMLKLSYPQIAPIIGRLSHSASHEWSRTYEAFKDLSVDKAIMWWHGEVPATLKQFVDSCERDALAALTSCGVMDDPDIRERISLKPSEIECGRSNRFRAGRYGSREKPVLAKS